MMNTLKRAAATLGAVALVTVAGVGAASAEVVPGGLVGDCNSKVKPGPEAQTFSNGIQDIAVSAPHCVSVGAQDVLGSLSSLLNQ